MNVIRPDREIADLQLSLKMKQLAGAGANLPLPLQKPECHESAQNQEGFLIGNNSNLSNFDSQQKSAVTISDRLSAEKCAYFEWRETWIAYDNFDSQLDENEVRRRELSITVHDECIWREMKDARFILEF